MFLLVGRDAESPWHWCFFYGTYGWEVGNLEEDVADGDEGRVLDCKFYMAASGIEPTRVWLKSLAADVRHAIGVGIQKVQWIWPAGPPLVDGLGQGLYEVRIRHARNIYRVFFAVDDGVMWLLHGIMKKSRKSPKGDVALARKRQREIEET